MPMKLNAMKSCALAYAAVMGILGVDTEWVAMGGRSPPRQILRLTSAQDLLRQLVSIRLIHVKPCTCSLH